MPLCSPGPKFYIFLLVCGIPVGGIECIVDSVGLYLFSHSSGAGTVKGELGSYCLHLSGIHCTFFKNELLDPSESILHPSTVRKGLGNFWSGTEIAAQ